MGNFLENLLNDGGPVIYVILFFLVLALVIFAERHLVFLRSRIDTAALLNGLMRQLKNGNITVAIANCEGNTGPVGEIFRTAIEHWGEGEAGIRFAVEETGRLLIGRLEKRMKLLAAISSVTPIIGLLGTLCKIIDIFAIMKSKGGEFVGTMALAGDISGALVCTAAGLVVSLVAYLCYVYLTEKIDTIIREMQKGAAEITYFLTVNPVVEVEDVVTPEEKNAK